MEATFTVFDYVLFILMLLISALVGVYYGFIKKQKTATDYLLGGKQMGSWPIAMSLVSSSLSGLTLLSLPADIYRYGIMYWLGVPLLVFVMLLAYYVYIPVFYKLQTTSTYEYLKLRFDSNVRIFASVLFTIQSTLFLPIVIYVPAIALEQVTGINAHYITPAVCSVCIFYTTLGGMKAVVWTDAIQFVVMLGALLAVVIIGAWNFGLGSIFSIASAGGRLDISFDPSLIKRDTFWACSIANFFTIVNHFACSQSFVQKCLSLNSFKSLKFTLILALVGVVTILTSSMFTGLIMYAKYFNCDPLERKLIKTHDQLLPLYVTEEANFIPGLPGLFISGIFSAALSTLSAAMNCLGATVYEDFISPFVSKDTSPERISVYLKVLVVFIGIVTTSLVYVVEKLGSLLSLTLSFNGVTAGPLLGLFTAGMLMPNVTSKGALYGGITSLVIMMWIVMTAQWYKVQGVITYPILPVSTDGCNDTILGSINQTLSNIVSDSVNHHLSEPEVPFVIFRLSFYWYTLIGVCIVFVVSNLVSCFTKDEKPLNRNCISPLVHFLLPEDEKDPPKYNTIEKALELVNKN